MKRLATLFCLATLATAAFAQDPSNSHFVTADPSLANEPVAAKPSAARAQAHVIPPATAAQTDLQLRPQAPSVNTILPTATVLRLKLASSISTATALPGQQFAATLSQPVEVEGRQILPAGAAITCQVQRATPSRRFSGKPMLAIKALSARLSNGETLNFSASVVDTGNPHHLDVDNEGRIRGTSPNPMDKIELGALTGVGAVAGAVIAGPEGLLIGTASGAMAAAGHILIKQHNLTLPAGTELIFELDAPVTAERPHLGGME